MGNYHVPFCRAVEGVTPSLTLIMLAKGLKLTGYLTYLGEQGNVNALGQNDLYSLGANLKNKSTG